MWSALLLTWCDRREYRLFPAPTAMVMSFLIAAGSLYAHDLRACSEKAKLTQTREKEAQRTYTGLVMIGAVAVLWIGVVLVMAEVHKNARPVFIVLGGVITLGLGYAYYDYSWKEDDEKTGAEQAPLMPPGPYGPPRPPPPGYPGYHEYYGSIECSRS